MKKKVLALLTVLFLMAALCTPVLAAENSVTYVHDLSGLLTAEACAALKSDARDISLRTNCGVYIVTLADYTAYGSGGIYDVAAQIFNNADNSFGVGADRSGILLLLSMDGRDWAVYVHGESAQYAFDDYGQTALEDSFLPAFGENDWYGGFSGYLSACDEYLTLAASGEPVRESAMQRIGPVVGISCVISLVICLVLKGRMKTVRRKVGAQSYVTFDGLNLTERYDHFTHTTQTVRTVEQKSSSSESGGGGNGRSGKF